MQQCENDLCPSADDPTGQSKIAALQQRYDSYLMAFPNVVGTGIGYRQRDGKPTDELCLVILVSQKLPADALTPSTLLPRELNGSSIDVCESGAFTI